jgi:hypothetical protein
MVLPMPCLLYSAQWYLPYTAWLSMQFSHYVVYATCTRVGDIDIDTL